jgi:hypothetical protein
MSRLLTIRFVALIVFHFGVIATHGARAGEAAMAIVVQD